MAWFAIGAGILAIFGKGLFQNAGQNAGEAFGKSMEDSATILADGLNAMMKSFKDGNLGVTMTVRDMVERMNAQGLRNGGDDLGSIAAAIAYTLRSSAEVLPQTAGKLHPLAERFAQLGATTSKVPAEFVSGLRNLLVEASDTLARERASVMGAAADVLAALGKRVDVVLAATTKLSAESFKGAVVDTAGGAAKEVRKEVAGLVDDVLGTINKHPLGQSLSRRVNQAIAMCFLAGLVLFGSASSVAFACSKSPASRAGVLACTCATAVVAALCISRVGLVPVVFGGGGDDECPAVLELARAVVHTDEKTKKVDRIELAVAPKAIEALMRMPWVSAMAQVGPFFSAKSAFIVQTTMALLPRHLREKCARKIVSEQLEVRDVARGVGTASDTLTRGVTMVVISLATVVLDDLQPGVRAALQRMTGGDMRGHLLLIDSEGTDAMNAAAPGVDGLQMQLVLQVASHVVFATKVRGSTAAFQSRAATSNLMEIVSILSGDSGCELPANTTDKCAATDAASVGQRGVLPTVRLARPTVSFRTRDGQKEDLFELREQGVTQDSRSGEVTLAPGYNLYLPVKRGGTGVSERDKELFDAAFNGSLELITLPPVPGELDALTGRPHRFLEEFGCVGLWPWQKCRPGVAHTWLHDEIPHVLRRSRPKRNTAGMVVTGAQVAEAILSYQALTRSVFGRITDANMGAAQVDSVVCDQMVAIAKAWVADTSDGGLAAARAKVPIEPEKPECPAKEDGGPCNTVAVCSELRRARATLTSKLCQLRKVIRDGWDACWEDRLRPLLTAGDDVVVTEHLWKCRKLRWKVGEWGPREGQCPGVHRRKVECVDHSGAVRDDACCAATTAKPVEVEDTAHWPVQWRTGEWGTCPAPCELKTRSVWCECTPTARAVKDTHCDAVAKPTTSQKCEAIVLPDKLVWGPDPCECGTQQSAVQTCSSCDRPPGQADCRLVAGALPPTLRACEGVKWRLTGKWTRCSGPCGREEEELECVTCAGVILPHVRCAGWPRPPVQSRECAMSFEWKKGEFPPRCKCKTEVTRPVQCLRCGQPVELSYCQLRFGTEPVSTCRCGNCDKGTHCLKKGWFGSCEHRVAVDEDTERDTPCPN